MRIKKDPVPQSETESCSYLRRCEYTPQISCEDYLYRLFYAGHYVAKANFAIKRQNINMYLILITVSGEGVYRDKTDAYPLKPGSALVLDCGMSHEYHAVSGGWEFKYIHFRGSGSREFTERYSPVIRISEKACTAVLHEIDCIMDELTETDTVSDAKLSARLSAHVYTAMMRIEEGSAYDSSEAEENIAAVNKIRQYMDRHFSENISMAQLAAMHYMTRPYFQELFRRTYGVTPHAYLTARRLERAKKLLTDTPFSVSQIAEQTGYTDSSAFTRTFVRHCGMTPSKYRQFFV